MAVQDVRAPAIDQPYRDTAMARAAPRPRVLHIITHFDMGGAEGVALGLVDSLRQEVDFAVFAVLRAAVPGAVGRDMIARLDAWNVPHGVGVGGRFKSGGVLVAAYRLIRLIERFRPDVIHLHTEIPELTFAVASLLSPAVRRVGLLRTVHNSVLWIDWPTMGRAVTARLAHGRAVAVSRVAADADAAIATRRARPRAVVIYNAVHRPPAAPLTERRAPSPFRLLFAGRLVHQKGADLLPAILAEAWRRTTRRDVAVTIAGTGALRDSVIAGLAGALDGWDVQMVPPIEALASRIATFDAVLMPSRFEGFALLPLEALLAGVPLVTTRAPGLDEAIPQSYPLAAPVDDTVALGTLLARVIDGSVIDGGGDDRAMAKAYGEELAERFSPAATARAYAECYRELAARA